MNKNRRVTLSKGKITPVMRSWGRSAKERQIDISEGVAGRKMRRSNSRIENQMVLDF